MYFAHSVKTNNQHEPSTSFLSDQSQKNHQAVQERSQGLGSGSKKQKTNMTINDKYNEDLQYRGQPMISPSTTTVIDDGNDSELGIFIY